MKNNIRTGTGSMRYIYLLKGLTCVSCGMKIEKAVSNIDGISSASLNLNSFRLTVEVNEGYTGDIYEEISAAAHKFEPDTVVALEGDREAVDEDDACKPGGKRLLRVISLITGLVLYAVTILLTEFLDIPLYIILPLYLICYLLTGGEVVVKAVMNTFRGVWLDEHFLMTAATLGAFAIGEYPEAVAVMLFWRIGEYFQDRMTMRSRKAISVLMDIRPAYANVVREGTVQRIPPEAVSIGEIILVKPGELIPLDGTVEEGSSTVDSSSLTGESSPCDIAAGDPVFSGTTNLSGAVSIRVNASFNESASSKILELVENAANRKANLENFITRFAAVYTPVVVGLAAVISVLPPLLLSLPFGEWLRRGLIFLVISCPCALVISIPLSFYNGIGTASMHGILVKGGNFLYGLNRLDRVVFDKTGTLTKGRFSVQEIYPAPGVSEEELLDTAAHAEIFSNHPIALSILSAYSKETDRNSVSDYLEMGGLGISARYNGRPVLVGSYGLMKAEQIPCKEISSACTVVYAAAAGSYLGAIVISDSIRQNSRKTIRLLKEKGIRNISMLTGDKKETAAITAKELGIDSVYSELLPGRKVELIESFIERKRKGYNVAFMGDGINDAPVIMRADIGIAMGGLGSDAAIEASDVVIMNDEPEKLITAIDIAAFTKRIVYQNICMSLFVKVVSLILSALGVASMWEAVFADTGVALLAVLNSSRIGRHMRNRITG